MAITTRSASALGLGLMLAGCDEPTIAWRSAQSPDHRYTATVEYDAPVLEKKDTYVFLESSRLFSRHVVYRAHLLAHSEQADCTGFGGIGWSHSPTIHSVGIFIPEIVKSP